MIGEPSKNDRLQIDKYYYVMFRFNVSGMYFTDGCKENKVSEIQIAPIVIQTEAQKRTSAQKEAIDSVTISHLSVAVKPLFMSQKIYMLCDNITDDFF